MNETRYMRWKSELDSATSSAQLQTLRGRIRSLTHERCGSGAGRNGDCRKKARVVYNREIATRAEAITRQSADAVTRNLSDLRAPDRAQNTPATNASPPATVWLAVAAGVALFFILH